VSSEILHRSAMVAAAAILAACGGGDVGGVTQPGPTATALDISASPAAATAGAAMSGITVTVLDASGHVVTGRADSITLHLLVPAGVVGATISGRTGRRAAAGVAVFDSVVVTTVGTGFRIIATAPGLKPDTSATLDVSAAGVAHLLFTSTPSTGRAAANLAALQVTVTDAFGNPTDATVALALEVAPAGTTVSGTTSVATVNGVATFANLQLSLPGTVTLRATVAGLTPVLSGTIAIGAKLHIVDAVPTLALGSPYSFHVSVQTDAGVPLPGATATIQLALQSSLVPPTPATTRSAATVSGVATLPSMVPTRPGSGYRLVATAPGLDADSSAAIAVAMNPVQVSVGGVHACSRNTSGLVACVGSNYVKELGAGIADTIALVPVITRSSVPFASVSAAGGSGHSCALTAAGAAWCWGYNGDGELGIGVVDLSASRDSASQVAGGHAFASIVAALSYTCALGTDSLAYCWGMDIFGSLGNGIPGSTSSPALVAGGHKFGSLAGGSQHMCALDGAGQAWCWGMGVVGQVGPSGGNNATTPIHAAVGRTFTAIAAGFSNSCGLDAAGAAWCWGLGFNPDTAVAVPGGLTFASISAGNGPICGITGTGELYCWGQGAYGQLGSGVAGTSTATPTLIPGGIHWTQVSVGQVSVCGIGNGELWCWGRDDFGQLGDGPPRANVNVPTRAIQ
jgi:alpha-tubulin suppressor-like RCC1 family protein